MKFIDRLAEEMASLVMEDIEKGIPERHSSNTGKSLEGRLIERRAIHPSPRQGDPRAYRQIYSGMYFIANCIKE